MAGLGTFIPNGIGRANPHLQSEGKRSACGGMDGTNPETEHSVADLLVLTFVAPPPRGKVAQRISLKLSGVPRPSALISLQPPSRISPLSHITLASIIL